MGMQEERLAELRARFEERGEALRAIQADTLREQAAAEENEQVITRLEAERATLQSRIRELEGSS